MARQRKIGADLEPAFRLIWADPTIPTRIMALAFDVSLATVFHTARRLGLPHRMPTLERLGLPPFGRRRGERAA